MAAVDKLQTEGRSAEAPSAGAFAITPHDVNELAYVTNEIYVGGAGDLKVVTLDGDTVTLKAVPVGTLLRLRVKQVLATGTVATNLIALY